MFQKLTVKNFRGFSELEVNELTQFNIVTGRNGAGKSAFLEALFLNSGPANSGLILSLSTFRGDNLFAPGSDRLFKSVFNKLNPAFPVEIRASWQENPKRASAARVLTIKAAKTIGSTRTKSGSEERITGLDLTYKSNTTRSEVGIRWSPTPGLTSPNPSYGAQAQPPQLIADSNEIVDLIDARYVRASHHEIAQQIHAQLTQLLKERRLKEIVDVLKKVDPRIRDIIPLNEDSENVVYFDLGDALVPMFLMGSGIFNIINLACTLATIGKGVILIDEIEDGVHYSAYRDMIELIVSYIRGRDIQVFAATHSNDFISTISEVCSKEDFTNVSALRFSKRDAQTIVTTFGYADLLSARDMGLELR